MQPFPARYEMRRLLGEGGMGQVYLVYDRERDAELALKVHTPPAGADAEDARFQFRQEFWAMAALRHPSLVAAYDYGELENGALYFTMAVVPGTDLAEAGLPQPETAVRGWLPGVAAALGYLHQAGYVHGDLKPENIRVLPDGSGMVMDLGLLRRRGSVGGPIRGSVAYMAPEAIRQGAVDARTDLYGLGVVLYQAIAGDPPFSAPEPLAVLKAHLHQAPAPLAPSTSRSLASAVMRLLAKEPGARFPSADALLAALDLAPAETGPATMLSSPVVGREAVQAALATGTGTTWLTGPTGSGKTRLLTEARAEAQLAGRTVFAAAGQGADTAPYQAVLSWLRALAEGPALEAAAPMLVRLLPELNVAPAPALDGPKERLRLHAAIATLALATRPEAVWLIDDADRLDAASADLVAHLRREGETRPEAAWRWILTAESAPSAAEAVALEPLAAEAVRTLASALLGQDELPAPMDTSLLELSAGWPGAIETLVAAWIASGALVRRAGHWEAAPGAAFELPADWTSPLEAELASWPADAQVLARAAAVVGAEGDLAQLVAAAALPDAAFFGAFATLEAAGLLERREQRFRFVRPAQAVALATTGDRAAHDRAAAWLEARVGASPTPALPLGDVLAVADHRLAGTAPLDALPWVFAGVDRAIALYAISTAVPQLRRALALEGLTTADRTALQARLGFALRYQGQIDEALGLYEAEVVPALRREAAPGLAQELVTLGALYQMKGRYPDARATLEEAATLADAVPDATAAIRARIFAGRVGYFSGDPTAARTHMADAVRLARSAGEQALLARALSFYGYLVATEGPHRQAEGLALLDEAIALSRDLGDLLEAHEALNNQGNVFLSAGRLHEARRAFEGCRALCERIGTPNETIFAHLNGGVVELELGDYAAAARFGRHAAALSRAQQRKFPESMAVAVEGLAGVHMGDIGQGLERLEAGLALTREIGNKHMELGVLVLRAEAALHLGDAEGASAAIVAAEALAEATHHEDQRLKLLRLRAATAWLQGAPEPSAEAAVQAAREADAKVELARALAWSARVRLARAQASEAAALLAEADTLAAETGLVGLGAEIAELRAQVAFASGDLDGAQDFWLDAHARAAAVGDMLTGTLAALGVSRLDPSRRDLAQEGAERAQALLAAMTAAERAAFLAYPGRTALAATSPVEHGASAERVRLYAALSGEVAAQTSLDGVMASALDAVLTLTGLERGFLLLYRGFEVTRQVFRGMREDEADEFSTSLANRVLWSGRALFIEDAQSDAELGGQQSILALNLHTVLGLPLMDGDEVVGVLLADARRVVEHLTDADLDLAIALGRQVGTAIAAQRRLTELQTAHDALAQLHRLAIAAAGAASLEDFLAPMAGQALAVTGAERALLLLGPDLTCRAAFGPAGRLAGVPEEVSTGISRWVYEHGEPLQLEDAQSDEAFQAQRSVLALGLRTVVAAPVRADGRVVGVLYLDARRLLDPPASAMPVLQGIADLVGAYWARRDAT